MVEKTTGVILRVLPLTESSLIVDWLTSDFGRISTAAKGARRTKSPFRGKLDLFFLGEFSFTRSRRSDLHALREVEVAETHAALRKDLALLQQAAYCAKLIVQTTEADTPVPGMFELFQAFLRACVQGPARARTEAVARAWPETGLEEHQQRRAGHPRTASATRLEPVGRA
jgi:DNA repair protein RecO (recombination protein O)